ncbi:GNAT family N-acetyltransferase [Paenibacillus sp. GD4]|uniref:GNAT family N-acetyltransferase n=1 Tax=Paenibacillus sp. GD4 TaxID=3068890 RepID=UPI0027966E30|nr:GNAT family N-acetyltransferase [Paenibacillus sp. GD4]MDQ1912169.1 GNAT family N-acetyltransferase [Paenibacillus sp. GD4]
MKLGVLSNLSIRRAESRDLPAVLELWLEAADWIYRELGIHQWKPSSFTIESVTEHFRKTELFVAVDGERVMGTYSVQWNDPFIWGDRDDEQSGYIHRLVVSRSYRGEGVGRLLLEQAAVYIRSQGKDRIRLDCMADNVRLNEYYRHQGFEYLGRVDKPYFSASLYEKK